MNNQDRWDTAVHESGHAVAGIVSARTLFGSNDHGFDSISINPDQARPLIDRNGREVICAGLCDGPNIYTPLSSIIDRDRLKRIWRTRSDAERRSIREMMEWQIVRDLAGGAANAAAHGHRSKMAFRWDPLFRGGNQQDLKNAELILQDLRLLTGRQHGLHPFNDRTHEIVLAQWPAIEALAKALLKAGRIEFEEGNAIVGPLLAP